MPHHLSEPAERWLDFVLREYYGKYKPMGYTYKQTLEMLGSHKGGRRRHVVHRRR